MFCYQCQETAKNEACRVKGVCGKDAEIAQLQDLLVWLVKGIAYCGVRGRALGIAHPAADRFVIEALFATVTNVNFDAARFVDLCRRAIKHREALRNEVGAAQGARAEEASVQDQPEMVTWIPDKDEPDAYVQQGARVGVQAQADLDPDIRSLRELMTYGLKGIAAYLDHAYLLGQDDPQLLANVQDALLATADEQLSVDDLTAWVLRCGEMGVRTMALLDRANTTAYGNPEPTQVTLEVKEGPAILISGHDLRDLAELLEQTDGRGVNVYTHGEMLPAHGYPAFKKYAHFAGHYGGAWWAQRDEFERFGGAILMTTNCLVPPKPSYQERLFTTGHVGWPRMTHIADRKPGGQKDFSPVIAKALASASPQPLEKGSLPVGFAHNAVLAQADKILAAIQSGAIKRFVVMGGCDGRHKTREYYTETARELPQDAVILTAGCAKYRYNKLALGDIGGIPRVLDAGQCNDSYSLVVIAQKLAEALGIEDLNELPITYDIAWYEQKAVTVLLALLSLGVKKIRLGPTLPAFLSPGVAQVLVEKFEIQGIGQPAGQV